MGHTIGNNFWENDIYLFEETDVLQGGPAGIDNVPLAQLANRTAWLKNQLGLITNLSDQVVLTNDTLIDSVLQSHLIVPYAAGTNMRLTLGDPHTFKHGSIIPITAFSTPGNVITVSTNGYPILNPVDGALGSMYMHHNEQLMLVSMTDHWYVMNARGNFYCVGEEVKARKQILNTLPFRGQLIDRSAFPRLWSYVQSLTLWQEVTDEWSWWNYGDLYRGLFSLGDGVSNFRLPDERGLFDRMLDLGRGLDSDRTHSFPGGYEDDQIRAHTHDFDTNGDNNLDNNSSNGYPKGRQNNDNWPQTYRTKSTGGGETRPKNIGKINLIKF